MKRRKYTKAFKIEAVRLLESRAKPAADLARELGVRRNQLYKWQHQLRGHGESTAGSSGQRSEAKLDEVETLKRRVAELEEELTILKKADAYFTDHDQ